jgi:predicted enzyme related to lactoylglutathione lyase
MGFQGPGAMPGDPPGRYFVARLRDHDVAGVGSQPAEGAPAVPAWSTYLSVESADDTAEKASSAGGKVVMELFDALPAGRMAVLADPGGAQFCAWEPRARQGAQRVNQPGAWSMSQLATPDPEGSKAFYGAVFGWTTDTFDLGHSQITLFRLPGYVGGEPGQPVSPEVVAVMPPVGSGVPDNAPAQWSVDFWVDDVDATAEKAVGLGGSAVAPPVDASVGRTAVLADPRGATFSVSKVGPSA